jgi:hypothetical protein
MKLHTRKYEGNNSYLRKEGRKINFTTKESLYSSKGVKVKQILNLKRPASEYNKKI